MHLNGRLLSIIAGQQRSMDGGTVQFGIGLLSHPIKLRLSRAAQEKELKDYGTNVVLIEPLATITAVDDFLFKRVEMPLSQTRPLASAASRSELQVSNIVMCPTYSNHLWSEVALISIWI